MYAEIRFTRTTEYVVRAEDQEDMEHLEKVLRRHLESDPENGLDDLLDTLYATDVQEALEELEAWKGRVEIESDSWVSDRVEVDLDDYAQPELATG
jgi:hypothetical protein